MTTANKGVKSCKTSHCFLSFLTEGFLSKVHLIDDPRNMLQQFKGKLHLIENR